MCKVSAQRRRGTTTAKFIYSIRPCPARFVMDLFRFVVVVVVVALWLFAHGTYAFHHTHTHGKQNKKPTQPAHGECNAPRLRSQLHVSLLCIWSKTNMSFGDLGLALLPQISSLLGVQASRPDSKCLSFGWRCTCSQQTPPYNDIHVFCSQQQP